MKIIRKISIYMLIISALTFGLFQLNILRQKDTKPPEITFDEDPLKKSCHVTEEELLEGVSATDRKSGDVSQSIVIESISDFISKEERIITYAAIDEAGNVARKQRTLCYSDYAAPEFGLSTSLRYPQGRSIQVLSSVTAKSMLDGDLTNFIKYSITRTIDISTPGFYPIEYRVMDSAGNTVYLETEIEIYDSTKERLQLELTDYIVYLPVGAQFDPMKYYKNTSSAGGDEISLEPEINSNVNTKAPGQYIVDYLVEYGDIYGKNRLIVIVTE